VIRLGGFLAGSDARSGTRIFPWSPVRGALDTFDFTMFLLIMVPISQEFGVPLTEVAFLLSVTVVA